MYQLEKQYKDFFNNTFFSFQISSDDFYIPAFHHPLVLLFPLHSFFVVVVVYFK